RDRLTFLTPEATATNVPAALKSWPPPTTCRSWPGSCAATPPQAAGRIEPVEILAPQTVGKGDARPSGATASVRRSSPRRNFRSQHAAVLHVAAPSFLARADRAPVAAVDIRAIRGAGRFADPCDVR